jgi:serine phosphatase RsbU (regulator of sigma subunit)/anti-sigma regulatory factor (Ser/Thr protein kinase)
MEAAIRVLIVSQDEGVNSLIQYLLKNNLGIVCTFLKNSEQNDLFADKLADLFQDGETEVIILCDCLQQLNIIELIKLLKQRKNLIPIIVISTRNETPYAVEVIKSGAENFLVQEFLNSVLLSDAIYGALQNKEAEKQLEKVRIENQKLVQGMEKNINKAKRLHRHFFPIDFPEITGIELAAFYKPAANIGSDYYNFIHLNGQLIIYVVDVSGSGIDGAFINIFIRQKINRFLYVEKLADDRISPKKLLNFLAKHFLAEQFPEEYFICLYVAVLDLNSRYLTYGNAGFQIPPMIAYNGELTLFNLGGLPISSLIDMELLSYEEEKIYFNEGSTLVITTDGIAESEVDGGIYGIERFQELVLAYSFLPPKELKKVINADIADILNTDKTHDDITYVIMQTPDKVLAKKQLIIKSDCHEVEIIVEEIATWLETYTKEINGLLVGFNEMVYNAIEHGNKFAISKKIIINIVVKQVYILITIEDEGEGFNWWSRMNQQLDIMNFEERGRGIIFTKASFDYFTYNKKGNKVFLYKKIE